MVNNTTAAETAIELAVDSLERDSVAHQLVAFEALIGVYAHAATCVCIEDLEPLELMLHQLGKAISDKGYGLFPRDTPQGLELRWGRRE